MGHPDQSGHTGHSGHAGRHMPRLIAWEVTRSCLLACKHCRAAAHREAYEGELTTEECFRLLDNIASFAKPIIILTGGEPMLRADIYDIAAYGTKLGLRVVMAPCGVLLNDETTAKIVESGIQHISISLDGATAESHDAFRGIPGAFDSALAGIDAAKRAGIKFQINTTVSRHNLDELGDILELSVRLGADVFNPFLLVPTGRGKDLADQEITPEEYEQTLNWLADQQTRDDIRMRVTCAPHYQRILRQRRGPDAPDLQHGMGCMGGKAFAFISHRGKVQICGFLDVECGDVRAEDFDFRKIWETSEVFRRVRDVDCYHGRCGHCEFRKVCGGCRARAYALSGNYLAEEPYCVYEPKRGRRAAPDLAGPLDDADRRLLSVVQVALPVAERPFDELGAQLGLEPADVVARLSRLSTSGTIRRFGPIFDSKRLGYSSTLVAVKAPPARLDEVAETVNRLPGVTHNYRREHVYNLWFTLTAPSPEHIESTLDDLRRATGIADFHNLPALSVYKTRVTFRLSEDAPQGEARTVGVDGPAVALDEEQKHLVRLLQDDLPVVREPFAEVAAELGRPVEQVITQIAEWLESGVIRRFGAVVRHRRLGFTANGMAVFAVPEERIDEVGGRLADCPEVTHCYRRPRLPDWPYDVFAMVHGRSAGEVLAFVARVAEELGLPEHNVLFSTTEYKKVSMQYFLEAPSA